jgi:hypothetical protein
MHGMGGHAISLQKNGKSEWVVAYATKGLSLVEKKLHPIEDECYALVWGIMHFKQHLYHNHFTFRTNHKHLE